MAKAETVSKMPEFKELSSIYEKASDFGHALALMYWDQSVNMPPGGTKARGRSIGALAEHLHLMTTDPKIGALIKKLDAAAKGIPQDSFEAHFVRLSKRDYDRATRVPAEFVGRMTTHSAETMDKWVEARKKDQFKIVRPYLEKTLEHSIEFSDFFPEKRKHVIDPLLDGIDYGMSAATLRPIFSDLRKKLVPLVADISEAKQVDAKFLGKVFPEAGQLEFGKAVAADIGYDFNRGRLDKSPHPFTIGLAIDDARITTRVNEREMAGCLFSIIHEAGHGMYEQGLDPALDATPVGAATSMGMHESQSRLWENVVGRSRGFWECYLPRMKKVFPAPLKGVTVDQFYKAINQVKPGLIRTEADEVTYNLHVMIRFDLELRMLEGKLSVADLPEEWKDMYERDLGLRPKTDAVGAMQDIHWYHSRVGGQFQCYTLGNIMAAQLYNAAVKAKPSIPADIKKGKFAPLLGWMRENVHKPGRKLDAADLLRKATGKSLDIGPYAKYLETKYGEIYGL